MLKLEYPSVRYYIGTAREVVNLRKNFFRKGIAYQCPHIAENISEMDFRNGSLYALSVDKGDDEFLTIWKKGESFIVEPVDVAYILKGELERRMVV